MTSHITLLDAPLGQSMRIRQLRSNPETSLRLREMGFCENALIRCLMRGNGNLICQIRNTRIGIDNNLARSIVVSASE